MSSLSSLFPIICWFAEYPSVELSRISLTFYWSAISFYSQPLILLNFFSLVDCSLAKTVYVYNCVSWVALSSLFGKKKLSVQVSSLIFTFMLWSKLIAHKLHATRDSLGLAPQMLALGSDCYVEKPFYRWKTPLVVGGTPTQVLADSIAIAASALHHYAT